MIIADMNTFLLWGWPLITALIAAILSYLGADLLQKRKRVRDAKDSFAADVSTILAGVRGNFAQRIHRDTLETVLVGGHKLMLLMSPKQARRLQSLMDDYENISEEELDPARGSPRLASEMTDSQKALAKRLKAFLAFAKR
jgi:hypothetical protein